MATELDAILQNIEDFKKDLQFFFTLPDMNREDIQELNFIWAEICNLELRQDELLQSDNFGEIPF